MEVEMANVMSVHIVVLWKVNLTSSSAVLVMLVKCI